MTGQHDGTATRERIEAFIAGQPEPKRGDLQALHQLVLGVLPEAKLWFLDGRNAAGKVVSNPNIGYGSFAMVQAGGVTRDFYRIGLSPNTTGISVYVMTLKDKTHLARTYGAILGKASVTGYCIKFRSLKDIDIAVLEAAIRDGAARD
jgi:Domain of unknown function (DU1801)